MKQLLFIQDGKLYGIHPFSDVIFKSLSVPKALKNHEFQKEFLKIEPVTQLQQVRPILVQYCSFFVFTNSVKLFF